MKIEKIDRRLMLSVEHHDSAGRHYEKVGGSDEIIDKINEIIDRINKDDTSN